MKNRIVTKLKTAAEVSAFVLFAVIYVTASTIILKIDKDFGSEV